MTVQDRGVRTEITATAGQTVLTYDFEVHEDADLAVFKDGTRLTLTTDYTVSGAGADTGGTITLVTPASAGEVYIFLRDMDLDREQDYADGGNFKAQQVNDDFDRLWLAIQQITGGGDTLTIDLDDDDTFSTLIPKPTIPLTYLRVNAALTSLEWADPNGTSPLTSITGIINLDDYVTVDGAASTEINEACAACRSNRYALVSYDPTRTYTLDAQVDMRGIPFINLACSFDTTPIDNTAVASTRTVNGVASTWDNYCMIVGGFSYSTSTGGTGNYVYTFGDNDDKTAGLTAGLQALLDASVGATVNGILKVAGAPSAGEFNVSTTAYAGEYDESIIDWRFRGEFKSSNVTGVNHTVRPQLSINGVKNFHIEIGKAKYVRFYQQDTLEAGVRSYNSNAYGRVDLTAQVNLLEIDNDQRNELEVPTVGWFTEVEIHNGRLIQVKDYDKGYIHNHVRFYGNNFEEQACRVDLEVASNWLFKDQRWEGISKSYTITGITEANPAVVTVDEHFQETGDEVYIYAVTGMTLAEGYYTITKISDTQFSLDSTDTTSAGAFVSGNARGSTLILGEKTYLNSFHGTWVASLNPYGYLKSPFLSSGVIDNGVGNEYALERAEQKKRTEVFSFSGDNTLVSNGVVLNSSSSSSNIKGLVGIPEERRNYAGPGGAVPSPISSYFPNAFTQVCESPLIPVKAGDIFAFYADVPEGNIRYNAYLYDAEGAPLVVPAAQQVPNQNILTGAGMWFSSSELTTYTADGSFASGQLTGDDAFENSGLTPNASCSIITNDIAYIRFKVYTGDVACQIKHVSCYYYENAQGNSAVVARLEKQPTTLYLDSEPTMGFADMGTVCSTEAGDYVCSFALATKLNGALANGATSVTVEDVSLDTPLTGALQAGDLVGILLTDNTMHWTAVDSGYASGLTFTIDTGVDSPTGTASIGAADGAIVYLVRWTAAGGDWTYSAVDSTIAVQDIDFTSLPAGLNEIEVYVTEMRFNGGGELQIQLGDSGGFETTGYVGRVSADDATNTNFSAGFQLCRNQSAAQNNYFKASMVRVPGTNRWQCHGTNANHTGVVSQLCTANGFKLLSDELTQVRVTSTGSDNFNSNDGIFIRYK